MTETTHYHLKKPAGNDFVGPGALNENAEILDAALHELEEGKLAKDSTTGKLPEGMLPPAPTAVKATPVDADWMELTDTAADNARKKLTWAGIKATLANVFAAKIHGHAWGDISGKPSTFTPAGHTHAQDDVTGLASALAGKAAITHAATHKTGGTDALKAADIGACAKVAPVEVPVPVASWAGTGPWTQTVTVAGVTASDEHIGVFPVDVADDAARKLYEKAYGCLAAEADTVAGGVLLTCRDAKPETNFNVKIKGVR